MSTEHDDQRWADRPALDATDLLGWLDSLPPLDRIDAADTARGDALALVGRFADVRRAAVAEAHAQGHDVDLSPQSIREAVRPDRETLQAALKILARDGVSSIVSRHLTQGLAPRAPLDAVARRVIDGVTHLNTDRVTQDEYDTILAAHGRAQQILPTDG